MKDGAGTDLYRGMKVTIIGWTNPDRKDGTIVDFHPLHGHPIVSFPDGSSFLVRAQDLRGIPRSRPVVPLAPGPRRKIV